MWFIQLCCLVAAAAAYQNYDYGNDYNNNYDNYAPAPQQYAPAPQQYAPQQYAPAPQQYAPAPQRNSYRPSYQSKYQQQPQRPTYQPQQSIRQNGRSGHNDDVYNGDYNYVTDYAADQYNNYNDGADQDYDYGNYRQPVMRQSGRSSGHHGGHHGGYKPATKYVPVVVKKKSKKKTKIITTQHGFYIPGGTQMFGKFADLHSCQKACELTPTCFAGDFNPWVKKCFMHNNLTACTVMKTHQQITHFKKVPCTVVDTPRGLVTLGTQIFKGIEIKGIKSLTECIKKCANLGGGIAPTQTDASVASTPQLCFGLDYDFSNHKCYVHTDATLCTNVATILTPKQLVAHPSSVNILLCALTMSGK